VCADSGFTVVTSVGGDGLLHGLRLDPHGGAAWQPPHSADTDRFTERDVILGTGPLAVPGALSLPVGPGPWPAVVLLSGGGAFDRDESSGPNKQLKGLAWGLVTRQVAVLRFDEAAFAHPDRLPQDFTMADEYLPPALAAVLLLRQQPEVAPDRIHLLGHSWGGKATPRISAADPSIAGLVLLAADARPMHEATVRVARHLASLTPGPGADEMVAALARQAALVAAPALGGCERLRSGQVVLMVRLGVISRRPGWRGRVRRSSVASWAGRRRGRRPSRRSHGGSGRDVRGGRRTAAGGATVCAQR
jgi:hypothetical protein